MSTEVTNRFSDRVQNYIKYRPSYPDAMVDLLLSENVISKDAVIADVGSGTGISSELFLKHGFTVYGIEPNDPMRHAAEEILKSYADNKKFISVNGTAEHTGLSDKSVDTVISAQAFHWFDRDAFKKECERILKPNGQVALIWNDRRTDTNDFLKVYEDFLNMFAIDYKQVNHKNIQDKTIFDYFFGAGNYREYTLFNYQDVDLEGLKGRVLSSSYMPNEGHKEYDYMIYVLRKIFQRYQQNGKVRLEYDTKIYTGQIS
jgi:ubiquinone/menaquinone biosynthesis C-methylase UbiE